jgi:L-fucose mutarotase/ribose pyranase (RbsD/FucU family)
MLATVFQTVVVRINTGLKKIGRIHRMKETGFLNREISDVISMMGHMDELIVCDAGFPIPLGVRVVDISLAKDKPTVLSFWKS